MSRAIFCSSLCIVLLAASPGWAQSLTSRVQALEAKVDKLTRYIQIIGSTNKINGLKGPHVMITGANVHIRGGHSTMRTHTTNGLGNLIIGYNEANTWPTADAAQRGGSHNLVIGQHHQYPNSGGLVAGDDNVISGYASSVSGGERNTARGDSSSVSGGERNTARSGNSSVSGGAQNVASGPASSVSGGKENEARNTHSSVSGGRFNKALGSLSSVSGGRANTASGHWASVLGGHHNTASSSLSSVSGGDGITVTARAADLSYLWPACLTTEAVPGQTKANVVFEGCNVHIRNGSSRTATINGRGNLIVGYNEDNRDIPVVRGGSHNVVIGPQHEYTKHSGLVVGLRNDITGEYSSVSGGRDNAASGESSSVSGGLGNQAIGLRSSVSGGWSNVARESAASVSGGEGNWAMGEASSVSGGRYNRAIGKRSSISGGKNQVVNGDVD